MASARALLLLGGNVGDRLARLRAAARALDAVPGCRVRARSKIYETEPVGPSRRRYLNAVVAVETSLSPMGLLVECKRLESEAGRRPGKRWAARPLDVDILTYADRRLSTPWLIVPHPRMHARQFTLVPLRDVAPRLVLKGGATPASAAVPASVRIYPHAL